MADRNDDSMLFSFRGLFDLDQKRAQHEGEAHMREAEISRLELEQRERLAQEARERCVKAEQETRRQYELREREVAARHAALGLAAIACARVEAESRARLAELEQQQIHQLRLSKLCQSEQLRTARRISLASGLIWLLTLATCGALYFAKLRPENARLQDAYDRLVTAERARSTEATRLLTRAESRRAALAQDNDRIRKQLAERSDVKVPSRAERSRSKVSSHGADKGAPTPSKPPQ